MEDTVSSLVAFQLPSPVMLCGKNRFTALEQMVLMVTNEGFTACLGLPVTPVWVEAGLADPRRTNSLGFQQWFGHGYASTTWVVWGL